MFGLIWRISDGGDQDDEHRNDKTTKPDILVLCVSFDIRLVRTLLVLLNAG